MTVLVISLIVIAASLVGIKVYLQEKNKEQLEQAKTPEQVVYERLQEIAKFESDLEVRKEKAVEEPVEAAAPVVAVNPAPVEEKKPKAKNKVRKKIGLNLKKQPKIKAK